MAKRDFVDHSDSVDPVGESETEMIALLLMCKKVYCYQCHPYTVYV